MIWRIVRYRCRTCGDRAYVSNSVVHDDVRRVDLVYIVKSSPFLRSHQVVRHIVAGVPIPRSPFRRLVNLLQLGDVVLQQLDHPGEIVGGTSLLLMTSISIEAHCEHRSTYCIVILVSMIR